MGGLDMKYIIEINILFNYYQVSDNDIKYNLEQETDNVLNDINRRTPVKLRNNTPQILVSIGIKDLPMHENPSHIRKNIYPNILPQKNQPDILVPSIFS